MVKRSFNLLMGIGAFAITSGTALADGTGGCVNSPENPTLILALLAAAATGTSGLRARLRARFFH